MNYIPEVAKMLGVEIGEEFKIKGRDGTFKFNELYLKYKLHDEWILATCAQSDLLNGKLKLIKIPKPILTDKEKEYLTGAIKLFREKVEYICKLTYDDYDEEYIYISFDDGTAISLPDFDTNAMYKGMKLGKEYSLEDLGV